MTGNVASGVMTAIDESPNAFDTIAEEYDRMFTHSVVGAAQRSLVHEVLRKRFCEGQHILDLNCGTGEDALLMAERGISVVACDVSERMIDVAWQKYAHRECSAPIIFAVCANERLDALRSYAPFDGALSNFGGLNCTKDLAAVGKSLARLIRPGGQFFCCLIGRVCAWEIIWYIAHRRWSKAFRRTKRGGNLAHIGGVALSVYYPTVRAVCTALAPAFRLASWRGVGTVLPPSWMEAAFERRPALVGNLARIDRRLGVLPGFRSLGDHVLLRFVRGSE
jgi:ubiquinone/menaquinone biosynthesis C-methylase UbiE